MHTSLRSLFLSQMAQTSPEPLLLEIVHASGHYLTDANGNKLLDLISGISVSSLGHSHPQIVKAVQEQAEKYMHLMVYGELVQAPQVQLAARLTSLLPESLDSVYFVNSGAEAVEGAMKLAKRYTGRNAFIAHTQAYHGSTQGALGLMDNTYFTQAYRPLLPGITFIEQNNLQALDNIQDQIAAILVEPVQAEKGAIPCTAEYLQYLRNYCSAHGTLLIFDEIQTGMGRTGPMFAFEKYGVVPDILLLGKAFGGGMPLGAFVASREIMHCLSHDPVLGHITTFGGHPVSCAASLAALELTQTLVNTANSEDISQIFRQMQHPEIEKITGSGLLLAVHLRSEEKCRNAIKYCIKKGVFTDWFLHAPHALRIAPPLTLTAEEARFAAGIILQSLEES